MCLRSLAAGDLMVRALILEEAPQMAMSQGNMDAVGVRDR